MQIIICIVVDKLGNISLGIFGSVDQSFYLNIFNFLYSYCLDSLVGVVTGHRPRDGLIPSRAKIF
jgi:hypothetical protein